MNCCEKNLGIIDRTIRILIAVFLVILGIANNWWWMYIIAAIIGLTGIFGRCCLYSACKWNTCGVKMQEKPKAPAKKAKTKKR